VSYGGRKAPLIEACKLSDQGCVRANNEDYCAIAPAFGLYVLADGMGGARAGETASRMAVETVIGEIAARDIRDSEALLEAVEQAHRAVLEAARQDRRLDGMGTTLVAALEVGGRMAIASVGDSRFYLLDEGGLRLITADQSWVHEVGRPLGLGEESLRSHPMRHVLTMAIGARAPLSINSYDIALEPGAVALVCSDGLHVVLGSEEIEAILRKARGGAKLDACCRMLIESAKERGGPDNITVIVMRKS
jgi:PPM family protein phosphatase